MVTTDDGRELRATPNHVMFARIDPDPACYYVYLMYHRRLGYRVGVTRGVRSGDDKARVPGIRMRTNHETADRLWILATCTASADARYLESYYAAEYGSPRWCFTRGRRMALMRNDIERLYDEIDTPSRARRLMADLLLFPEYRIIEPARSRRRRVRARSSTSSCSVTRDRMRGTNTESSS